MKYRLHAKSDELVDSLHEKTAEAIHNWRVIADDPDVTEGDLREHLRQTINCIERYMESHAMQHDMLKHARRIFWMGWVTITLMWVAAIVSWLW
jgi:hypothetical protein